jgi:hypothetical protein
MTAKPAACFAPKALPPVPERKARPVQREGREA